MSRHSGDSFYSPALLALKRRNVGSQSIQLRHFVETRLGDDIDLRTANGWNEFPRYIDPLGQAEKFNENHVVADLSGRVPGLLGVFALTKAHPPGYEARTSKGGMLFNAVSPNLGYYQGYLMVTSEYTRFNKAYGHSMGVTLPGIKGRNPHKAGATEEGVILVGDPACTVAQALHCDSKRVSGISPNCVLTSRVQAGDHLMSSKVGQEGRALPFDAVVLQAQRVVRPGDELTFSYSPQWEHTSSCFDCCESVTQEQLENNTAFHCEGFIDASPCPFSMHRKCAAQLNLEYCDFCCHLSGLDDVDRTPQVWLDVHPRQKTTDAVEVGGYIVSTASFAAVMHKAYALEWLIGEVHALSPQPQEHQQVQGTTTGPGRAKSRVVVYECTARRSIKSSSHRHYQSQLSLEPCGPTPPHSSPPFLWSPPAAVHSPTTLATLSDTSEESPIQSPSTSPLQEGVNASLDSISSSDSDVIVVSEPIKAPVPSTPLPVELRGDSIVGSQDLIPTVATSGVISRYESQGTVWSFQHSESDRHDDDDSAPSVPVTVVSPPTASHSEVMSTECRCGSGAYDLHTLMASDFADAHRRPSCCPA